MEKVILMTIRETAIAKLQHLPEPLLKQVNDFIDFLTHRQQHSTVISDSQCELTEAWAQWFETVDRLEVIEPISPSSLLSLLTTLQDITDNFPDIKEGVIPLDDITL